ncbi:Programmed cell death 6-interacting protein [Smittium mucronatum]|uniref:Programmed cell death 6-interacting protein n=1 Tax=Smittium mucronatum TaxID=133383 RepID=A0A1R0GSU6_9FUNG|nr:Programmed cell death 6-interacting protein [Smittium mucronatum]
MLKESEASLAREFNVDQNLRLVYQKNNKLLERTNSSELTASYFSSINIFNQTLIKAIDNDSFISQKMDSWKQYILLLESGREKIMLSLPNSSSSDLLSSPQNKVVLSRLRQYYTETLDMLSNRAEKIESLRSQLANDDINSDLIAEVEKIYKKADSPFVKIELDQFEPLFTDRLSAYSEWHKYYQEEVGKQSEMLDSLSEANLAFIAVRKQNSVANKRVVALGNLQLAIDRFHEIMKNLNEGIYFYQKLVNSVIDLRRRCADFCMARNVEADDLLASLGYSANDLASSNLNSSQVSSNHQSLAGNGASNVQSPKLSPNSGGPPNSQTTTSQSPSSSGGGNSGFPSRIDISSWDPSTPLKYNSPRK